MTLHKKDNSRGRRDWRKEQPEPPAQRINSFMLEDPMYEYMEEKRRREKQDRIDQLKALLDSSTDSESASESEQKAESKKSKKKRKDKKNKKRKRSASFSSTDDKQKQKKKEKHSTQIYDQTFKGSSESVKDIQEKHKDNVVYDDTSFNVPQTGEGISKKSKTSGKRSHSKHKKDKKKKKKKVK